ncbi:NAD(+) kinase [Thiotrichales bacterium 19S9-12]|nr:NAD(+) kinase [Thiotrichales bacterium 19S9-11]MCF6811544.1 NAD(+) kinase [Thiotrichales bacterium 19S9-12]
MNTKFNCIAIIGTHQNPLVKETVFDLYQYLMSLDIKVIVEENTAETLNISNIDSCALTKIANEANLAIVVGGDGNFLHAARSLAAISSIPITGINRGKLGFLTDINPQEIKTRLKRLLEGQYQIEQRFILNADIYKNNQKESTITAVNDIVLSTGHSSRLFEFSVEINGQYAFSQRSDGIIIASPTGSTAHALSAGGSILYPSLNIIELVPMFSHSLTSRPIIISADSTIKITVAAYNDPTSLVSYDGHCHTELKNKNYILIKKAKHQLNILHPEDYNYYQTLRHKLHWSRLLFDE